MFNWFGDDALFIFPVITAVLALSCALVIGTDMVRRPRPDKQAWFIAFLLFAVAAGVDAYGRELGWSAPLARLYYATGPALVVAFLAVGELYLLAPRKMGRFAPGAMILLTASWISLVLGAPIDQARLASDGWEAIQRDGTLRLMAISINSIGTTIIVAGLIWSVWRFARTGTHRPRMVGCMLIVAGTIAVATGGTLTRLGNYEYLYIAMSLGIALMFGGVLVTRRRDQSSSFAPSADNATPLLPAPAGGVVEPYALTMVEQSQEIAFLVERVLHVPPTDVREVCLGWSVRTADDPLMSRYDARRAWRLRSQLPGPSQTAFDALPVPERRAVVELAADVLQIPALTRFDDARSRGDVTPRSEGLTGLDRASDS